MRSLFAVIEPVLTLVYGGSAAAGGFTWNFVAVEPKIVQFGTLAQFSVPTRK